MKSAEYKMLLRDLQIELVKLQREIISRDQSLLILLEGRDASGKDGVIKRITAHLSPRDTRVVALGKPSEREQRAWYFQRYVAHLPVAGEIVLFNRSWYNRAGVERVMKYCSEAQYRQFMASVNAFEDLLQQSGIRLRKYYLDISREEQALRLQERRNSPLKYWKISPVDESALAHWDDYSRARDDMLLASTHAAAPWTVIKADNKREARINLIRDILRNSAGESLDRGLSVPDENIVFTFREGHLQDGSLYQ